MNDTVHCNSNCASFPRKSARGAATLLAAALSTVAALARAATYDASTGYVTLLNGGAYGSDSPLTSNKVSKTNSATSELIDAWSDGLAPHSNTNYYAAKQFRTPASSKGHIEFQGGHLVVKTVVLWNGSGDSATLTFPNGLEVLEETTLRHNENGPNRRCQIFGPVDFSGNCTVNPSGGDNKVECGFDFYGEASSSADVTVTVKQRQSPRWGWFGLLGDTDGFLGTIAVESCGYELGTNGLPNGTVSFTGTNNVLRLLANEAAAAPVVKTLAFASAGPHEIRIEADGADYGKVRVTNAFSASGPITVSLSGTVADLGNARRFEFLRVPGGSLAGADVRLASATAGDYTLFLSVEKDGDEDVVAVEAHKRVTMQNGGANGESPLNAAQVSGSDAWSDGNAPTDPTLCYYATAAKQFRTPATSSADFAFEGGRFFCENCTMLLKTYSPAVLRFPRGLAILDKATLRVGDSGVKKVEIDGPVAFSGTSYVNPAGGNNAEESMVSFIGNARADADAEVVVRQQSATRRGFFSLASGTDGFLGTITVTSCNYLMGTNGLPCGALSFAGTNDVLRLPVFPAGSIPSVKALSFGDDGPATIEIECAGDVHAALRVTGAFSASVPPRIVLTGTLPHEAVRLEILRAPAGQFALADFAPAQTRIRSLAIEWQVVEDNGESVLVAKLSPSGTLLTVR